MLTSVTLLMATAMSLENANASSAGKVRDKERDRWNPLIDSLFRSFLV